jgi:hypothetical protein
LTCPPHSVGAALRRSLRHGLIAAADGRLDQFTGSGPILKRGVCRESNLDQDSHRAGIIEFRGILFAGRLWTTPDPNPNVKDK